ncbi:MAG: hypothetical protein KAU21_17860, partial [Gammaproteobacteria bacterium]|nr:hypothetical protein [Gammaproteobacteria bacterium]
MKLTGYSINSAIIASTLISANVNAAAPSYNIQLGLAAEDFDGKTDTLRQLTGAVHYSKGLSRHSVINLNADLFTRSFSDTENRDSHGVLAEFIYSYIPGRGYTKPVYSLALRQEFEKFDNTSQNFSKTSLILADTIRLDDQLTLTAGLEYSIKTSDLEDITSSGFFINSDFQLGPKLIVYLNLKIQDEKIEADIPAIANGTQSE